MSVVTRQPSATEAHAPTRSRATGAAVVLLASAGAIFALGLLLGLLLVGRRGGGAIQGWDDQVQAWDLRNRTGLVGISKVIAYVGDAPKLAVVAVLVTVVLLLTLRSVRALVPLVAYLGAEFEVYLIREIIHRPRPPTAAYPASGAIVGVHETSYSFPSGHSVALPALLFALLGSIALTYRLWWPWILASAGSLFVIDTRLVLGVHWFSDVVFGFLLGAAWGVTVAVVFHRLEWEDLREWTAGRVNHRDGSGDERPSPDRPGPAMTSDPAPFSAPHPPAPG